MLHLTVTLLFSLSLLACGEDKGSSKESPFNSGDVVKTEDPIDITPDSQKIIEEYNGEGDLLFRTEYEYGNSPIHPNYVKKNGEGETVESVTRTFDSEGFLESFSQSQLVGAQKISASKSYARNSDGVVTSITSEENSLYRVTEISLDGEGKEVSSEIRDESGRLLTERQIDWQSGIVVVTIFDAEGKPAERWQTKYLSLEMVEGELKLLYLVSQLRENLLNSKVIKRVEGDCDTSSKLTRCQKVVLNENNEEVSKTESSFYLVPFNNGFFQQLEIRELASKVSKSNGDNESSKFEYESDFRIKNEETKVSPAKGNAFVRNMIYYYDDEAKLQECEHREDTKLVAKSIYSY